MTTATHMKDSATMPSHYTNLLDLAREANLVGGSMSILGWDQEVLMPEGGIEYRGRQLALLAKLHHEMSTSTAFADALAECEAEVDQLHLELYGEPLQWTDDIPEVQREAPFREVMAAVEDQCGGRPMSHLDCSEPPCMAVYFGSAPQIGADCEPWAEAYGVASSNMSRRVECADGRQMRMVVLSPTAEAYASGEEMMARGAQRDPAVREQRSVRMNHRWNELALDIPCPAL